MIKTFLKCVEAKENEWYSGLFTVGKKYEILNGTGKKLSLVVDDEGSKQIVFAESSVYGIFEVVQEGSPMILEYLGTNQPYTALDVINNKRDAK